MTDIRLFRPRTIRIAGRASNHWLTRRMANRLAGPLIPLLCSLILAVSAQAADYCVSSSHGLDSNSGACPVGGTTGSPWQHISKVVSEEGTFKAGDTIHFLAGDVWDEELTLNNIQGSPGSPITFTSYTDYGQTGQPVIDGCGSSSCGSSSPAIPACIAADQSAGSGNNVKYITVGGPKGGFECRNTSEYGIDFKVESNAMPGILIQNNYIHHTGAGAWAGSGKAPYDDGHYANQLNAEDDTGGKSGGDGFQIVGNTVNNCGGHNCLQVHFDTGALLVQSNKVGPGCIHNCLDVKGVGGNSATGAMILNNYVTCPGCGDGVAAYYTENPDVASEKVTYQNNIAYNAPVGFQIENGGSCKVGTCAIDAKYYNNTVYQLSQFSFIDSSCVNHTLDIRKNIVASGAVDFHCAVTWDSNDNWNASGAPSGTNNISADPLFCGASASSNSFAHVSDFSPVNGSVAGGWTPDSVTPADYQGAVKPGLNCSQADAVQNAAAPGDAGAITDVTNAGQPTLTMWSGVAVPSPLPSPASSSLGSSSNKTGRRPLKMPTGLKSDDDDRF